MRILKKIRGYVTKNVWKSPSPQKDYYVGIILYIREQKIRSLESRFPLFKIPQLFKNVKLYFDWLKTYSMQTLSLYPLVIKFWSSNALGVHKTKPLLSVVFYYYLEVYESMTRVNINESLTKWFQIYIHSILTNDFRTDTEAWNV